METHIAYPQESPVYYPTYPLHTPQQPLVHAEVYQLAHYTWTEPAEPPSSRRAADPHVPIAACLAAGFALSIMIILGYIGFIYTIASLGHP